MDISELTDHPKYSFSSKPQLHRRPGSLTDCLLCIKHAGHSIAVYPVCYFNVHVPAWCVCLSSHKGQEVIMQLLELQGLNDEKTRTWKKHSQLSWVPLFAFEEHEYREELVCRRTPQWRLGKSMFCSPDNVEKTCYKNGELLRRRCSLTDDSG
jgi:hypothetical protein